MRKASRQASTKSKMWWQYGDVQCNRGCQPHSSVQIFCKQTRLLFISLPNGWLWPRDIHDISCRLSVPRLTSAVCSTGSLAHGICPLRTAENPQMLTVGNGNFSPSGPAPHSWTMLVYFESSSQPRSNKSA